MEIISKSDHKTWKIAKKFGKNLKAGDIVLLSGDLGSGKTVFSKGIASGLGIKDHVTSPTFTIYNYYQGKKYDLYHFDMYRIESAEEALAFGIDEIIDNRAIKLFEWPEVIGELLPQHHFVINISKIDDTTRRIQIERL